MNKELDIYVLICISYCDDYKDKSVDVSVLGKYKNYEEAVEAELDDKKKTLTDIILDRFHDDECKKYILTSDDKLNKYSYKWGKNEYLTINFEKFDLDDLIEEFISGEFVDYIYEWQIL